MSYEFSLDGAIKKIRKSGAKRVALQFPDGLKRQSVGIAKKIEKETGAAVIISGENCFGACDIDGGARSKADILLHFGHSPISKENKTVFIDVHSALDIKHVLGEAVKKLDGEKVGLITTAQHLHKLDEAREILESVGKKVVVGSAKGRIKHAGQILGCNFSSARIDCDELLYIGSGDFHPLGAALATRKKVIVADPYLCEVRIVGHDKILRERWAVIARAQDAKSFGILVSTKKGQSRMKLAVCLKNMAVERGYSAHLVTMNDITPEKLMAFDFDAWVSTACPRVAIDDRAKFGKPVLTPAEFEILMGDRRWEDYKIDEIRGDER